ncbi:cysteine-rich receptor-like protein kinase 34 isoform X2 [Rhododendron vialii]|uniref:cysteine-rich receptor-like protein kinase 34 isoform X2 n=1 Tax=Rhododendron vialii TaxID=182163 RepID=UPI00265D9242|nr:cysteine-rich receptor-like protein kinase 34 isoform X2 [Rhododendron vialii]
MYINTKSMNILVPYDNFIVMGISILFLLLSCILLALPLATAQPCPYPANFTANSTYGQNRNRILSSLASNATANGGFYTTTFAQGSDDTIYALALCRGDLSNQSCYDCVDSASHYIIASCPNKMEAFDFGNSSHCIVRCSNQSFFSTVATWPARFVWIMSDITANVDEFDQALSSLVDSLVNRVTTGYSVGYFATGEIAYTALDYIYGLVQCVPGLSSAGCSSCIRSAIDYYRNDGCCFRKRGVNIMTPSCIFQYDLSNFYESSAGAAPPPPPPPSPPPPPPPVTFSPSPPSTNVTTKGEDKSRTTQTTILILVPVSILSLLTALACGFFRLRKREDVNKKLDCSCLCNLAWIRAAGQLFWASSQHDALNADATQSQSADSLKYDFATVRAATNDFSNANMLGRGGFGSVYKGKLPNGQEIAVKRLDGCSGQGEGEFKNEIVLMARLQHRNLVRLLGFCFEGKERLLIYEFVPNASLDRFIFDPIKRLLLNWDTRYKIIVGIARGLVYLHQDSQLRIIHHDLKAGNVLLDRDMNPKIADFGMARLFVVDQSKGVTKRIAGTFGYMPPEYAKFGRFSVKTDVFSFGVLILEIVSGKKYSGYGGPEHVEHLISYAWKKWRQGKASRLIDETLVDGSESEKMRCIHIGLLCVQENVAKRPTMAAVVLMFSRFSMSLPSPSKPGFFVGSSMEPDTAIRNRFPPVTSSQFHSQEQSVNVSVNEASITDPYPR